MIGCTIRALTFALAACSLYSAAVAAPATAIPSEASASKRTVADKDYVLGAGDQIRMIVFNSTPLSGEFIISDSGTLSLPLIGEVRAKGRTIHEVQKEITTKFGDGYLRDPHVSLEVITYRPFYILGEVQKPGEYPYSSKLTIMQAIAKASGFTYSANRGSVFIKGADEPEEKKLKLTPYIFVNPGDTIRIGQRHF